MKCNSMMLSAAIATAALLSVSGPAAPQSAWKPAATVEIIVGNTPGGGLDRTARVIQKVLQEQKLVETPVLVTNKPGGGGAIAMNYLAQASGEANHVYVAPTAILTNEILGKSKLGYRDFTPIAMLYDEFLGFAVRPDSPIKNAKDLLAAFKTRPESIAIAFAASAGNTNHIASGIAAKAAGGDVKKLKIVIFSSNGEALTALLGGHVDMVVFPAGNLVSSVSSGKVNVIAIAAPKRVGGALANVPTWKEAGADVVVSSWKPLFGPKNMRPEQIAYWEAAVAKLTAAPDWTRYLDQIEGFANYMNSRQLAQFLDAQNQEYKAALTDLGLVK